MGSIIEINDTLKVKEHLRYKNFKEGIEYTFILQGKRIYHLHPIRVFLVIERQGKWDYIGHAQILKQTINAIENVTSGVFLITKIYDEKYRKIVNLNESPIGKSYQA